MSKFKTNEEYFQYAKTLAVIPTEDLVRLFQNYQLKFPTQFHRFVLQETIYPKVFQSQLYNSYTDELKYRLRGFKDYSLFLLEKLIKDYNLVFDAARYKEIFFNLLFLNREMYQLRDNFFKDLEKLKYKYAVDFEKLDYDTFMKLFQNLIYEQPSFIDGVHIKKLKEVLVHSCTLGDLRSLGERYSVKIPRRINKNQLIDILVSRFQLNEEQSLELASKSVLDLEIYAKENGFKISIDLKKTDMVEYILFAKNLFHIELQKDMHDYKIPHTDDLDSVKFEDQNFMTFEEVETPIPTVYQEEDVVTPALEPVVVKQEEKAPEVEVVVVPEQIHEEKPEDLILEPTEEPTEMAEQVISEQPLDQVEQVQETTEKSVPATEMKTEAEKKPEVEKKPARLVEVEDSIEPKSFTEEEQILLDDKINQIIKRYKVSKRRRRFWLAITWILLFLLFGCGIYLALYYFVVTPGQFPPLFPF